MDPLTRSRSIARRQRRRRLLLFCQHPIAQQRFRHLLSRASFEISIIDAPPLPAAHAAIRANLAVIDCGDAEAGLEWVRGLRAQRPELPLVVLLASADDALSCLLLRLGVKGVVTYRQAPHQLARAAGQVSAGRYYAPRELLGPFVESVLPELQTRASLQPEAAISRREREVLELLLENLSNKEIASRLFVAERTVKFHVSNLLSKFGVERRADLIIRWLQRHNNGSWQARDLGRPLSPHVN